jgi:hypothetical protein
MTCGEEWGPVAGCIRCAAGIVPAPAAARLLPSFSAYDKHTGERTLLIRIFRINPEIPRKLRCTFILSGLIQAAIVSVVLNVHWLLVGTPRTRVRWALPETPNLARPPIRARRQRHPDVVLSPSARPVSPSGYTPAG